MIVLLVNKIRSSFRGKLKNNLLEIKHDVFVGNLSKRIRDLIWNDVIENSESAIIIYSDKMCVCGYVILTHGKTSIVKMGNLYFSAL